MSEITARDIFAATQKAERMKYRHRDGLVAKVFRQQPRLLTFVADLSSSGLPADRIAFLYELVTVCVQAMNEVHPEGVVQRKAMRLRGGFGSSESVTSADGEGRFPRAPGESQLLEYAKRRAQSFLARRTPHQSDALMCEAVSAIVGAVQSSVL